MLLLLLVFFTSLYVVSKHLLNFLQGNIAKWVKKEGDKVAPGEVLCEVETVSFLL
jgi:hypothetical protein